MKTRADMRREIIAAVLGKYELTPEEFFGRGRSRCYTVARRDAAKQLSAAGFSVVAISRIIKRNRSTIDHYLYDYVGKKRDRARILGALRKAPQGVTDIVGAIAAVEGISPVTLVAQWIGERAEYEAQAKAREAA
jgi:hypothetical protein